MAEKKVFASIREVEVQIEAAHKHRQQRQEELLKEYLRAREPLLQRRYELVTGRSEPTDEELQGFKPQGAAAAAAPSDGKAAGAAAAGSAASSGGKAGGGGAASSGGKAGSSPARGVPFFWLNALCNEETLSGLITPRDRCALEYLEDVRYVTGPMGLALEFHFAPNPYFHNKVLRKGMLVKRRQQGGEDGEDGSAAAGPVLGLRGLGELAAGVEEAREEATVIDWKPGRSLLVRAVEAPKRKQDKETEKKEKKKDPAVAAGKKGKKGGGAGGGAKAAAAVPSRGRRHHGKHSGPAPDLPDPEDEEEQEAEAEEEAEEEQQEAADAGGHVRRRPCPSFFRFFLPVFSGGMSHRKELDPTQEPEGDDEEEPAGEEEEEEGGGGDPSQQSQQQAQRRRAEDAEVLNAVVKKVIPRAVHLYLAGGGSKGTTTSHGKHGAEEDEEEEEDEGGFQLVSGSPAGDVASLALTAQKALHALRALQRRLDELAGDLKRGEWEAWVAQAGEVGRLGARRRTLLVGPAGAPTAKLSIPAFWLRSLRAVPYGSLLVQHRDERALSYLADVRLVWDTSRMPSPEAPNRAVDLELEFLPGNPYFANRVLRKRFTLTAPGGSLHTMNIAAVKSDPIDWQPGRDLTVAVKAGGGGGGGGGGRTRKVPSFFALFEDSPGALVRAFAIPGGQSAAALLEASRAQEEFLAELINFVVQFPGALAAESNVDVDDLGDENDDDDDEEEEDEEDGDEAEEERENDEDREAAATRRAARRAAAKAARAAGGAGGGADGGGGGGVTGLLRRLFGGGGGGGGSRGGVVLGVFIVIMLLAQVLLFLDTLEYVRARFH